jgi:hypothetical protein
VTDREGRDAPPLGELGTLFEVTSKGEGESRHRAFGRSGRDGRTWWFATASVLPGGRRIPWKNRRCRAGDGEALLDSKCSFSEFPCRAQAWLGGLSPCLGEGPEKGDRGAAGEILGCLQPLMQGVQAGLPAVHAQRHSSRQDRRGASRCVCRTFLSGGSRQGDVEIPRDRSVAGCWDPRFVWRSSVSGGPAAVGPEPESPPWCSQHSTSRFCSSALACGRRVARPDRSRGPGNDRRAM